MPSNDPLAHNTSASEGLGARMDLAQEILSPESLKEVKAVMHELRVLKQESHSGPLPRPQDFGQYDVVLPGAADRILIMAEKEQAHRHAMESEEAHQYRTYLDSDIRVIGRGQWFTFGVITLLLLMAAYLVVRGEPLLALVPFITAIATGFGANIMGRRKQEKESRGTSTEVVKPEQHEAQELPIPGKEPSPAEK